MFAGFDFSWSQFVWIVFIFVGVPSLFGAYVVRSAWRSEQAELDRWRTGSGRLGLWASGLVAFALGFLSCAGWLSWSADSLGEFRGPALPAPTKFPTWQVVACGVTVVLVCFVAAHLSRWTKAGGLAAATGTTAGFTTAFAVDASRTVTSQEGVGVAFSVLGWGIGLGVLMTLRGAWLTSRYRGKTPRRR
ncbi:hypothetical protein C8K36_105216 [Rhodococcus sp. OK519]|uniref:hypothetical protein n=1 Tax=Rhodococcus sp. OK519 TaxID=2135729 RepID=UPI000D3DAEA8|nr:hypothetical protein C8K36_105216 [Rhodococcus sp. OK519]